MKYYNVNRKKRILAVYILCIISFIVLMSHLSFVKIIKGRDYYDLALSLWTRDAPVSGSRGNIYDRNGNLIAGSYLSPTIVAIPKQIDDPKVASEKIASITGKSFQSIYKHLSKKVSVEILKPELKNITYQMALEIVKLNLDGIYVVADTTRYYPNGNIMASILGITGSDNQGITGLEYIYNEYLEGESGSLKIYTDAHGNLINNMTSYYQNAKKGADLYLTIDLNIQLSLERILDNAVARYNPDAIWAIAMNPKTSEIYAMANRPTFDIINYQNYSQEIYNRNLPIWKCYEPGSVFKICTFSAGLEEKVFKLDEKFSDPGYLVVDGVRIKDWKAGGHGQETFLQVLQNSCNPGFMTIGLRLGKEKLFSYIENFGYGEKSGIDLLGESTGILFDIDKIGNVELATSSFGQGNSATAIQLINAACASINGGNLYTPYVLKYIKQGEDILLEKEPQLRRRVISEETSKTMRYALECVAALGTARGSHIAGYRVGGKTGTAQIAENGAYVTGKYILSYLGILPMDDPQIAIYIAIENPKNTIQYGGVVVAPMVKMALEESISSLNIPKRDDEIPLDYRPYIDKNTYIVPDFVGKDVREVRYNDKFNISIKGNGLKVVSQLPSAGELLLEGGTVILFTDGEPILE